MSYVSQLYRDIADEEIEISESDLKGYYSEHKTEPQYFQPEQTRSFDYIEFSKEPSDQDINALNQDMNDLKTQFEASVDDTLLYLGTLIILMQVYSTLKWVSYHWSMTL